MPDDVLSMHNQYGPEILPSRPRPSNTPPWIPAKIHIFMCESLKESSPPHLRLLKILRISCRDSNQSVHDLISMVSKEKKFVRNHRIVQLFDFFFFTAAAERPGFTYALSSGTMCSSPTARAIAFSNMSSTPCISLLLHSMYVAPILLATACPASVATGVRPWVRSSSMQFLLYRRSDLRPTRMIGVVGQK